MKYLLLLLLTLGCARYDLQSRVDRKNYAKFRNSEIIFGGSQKQKNIRFIAFRINGYFDIHQLIKNKRGKYTKYKFYFGLYENSDTQIVLRSLGSVDGFYFDTLKWSNQKDSLIFRNSQVFLIKHRPK